MKLYELTLHISNHALEQYCNRVRDVSRSELEELVSQQIQNRDYRREEQFVHIAGVWWVAEYTETELRLITCYGLTHFDIPAALAWARIQRDRIVLDHAE